MYKLWSVGVLDCGVQCDGWDVIVVAETQEEAVAKVKVNDYEWVDEKPGELLFDGFEIQIKKVDSPVGRKIEGGNGMECGFYDGSCCDCPYMADCKPSVVDKIKKVLEINKNEG